MVKLYFICWNYSVSSSWHIIAALGLVIWQIRYVNWSRVFFPNDLSTQWVPSLFCCSFLIPFFSELIVARRSCVIYVKEDNDSNVKAVITRLIWTIWTSLSPEWLLNLITHSSVREITKSSSTFSATNISSNMVWLLQLHDTIQMKSNYT